ncbi:MAG: hypothetical protein JW953_17050 [Anaerolineae bacterium]|nr:hypothetical protein [Anaerolineae bacterium]
MSISFSRSTRALNNDSFRPSLLGLSITMLVLAAWGVWFVFARVSLYETTTEAQIAPGEVVATFTPEQIRRIHAGQEAIVNIQTTTTAPAQSFRGEVMEVANRTQNRMEANTVRLAVVAASELPQEASQVEVQVQVEQISPLLFVLRTGQSLARVEHRN